MIRDLCPDIEMQDVADMTKPQMLDFCNMKLHVLREEALSSKMKTEFAKSQLLSCEISPHRDTCESVLEGLTRAA